MLTIAILLTISLGYAAMFYQSSKYSTPNMNGVLRPKSMTHGNIEHSPVRILYADY